MKYTSAVYRPKDSIPLGRFCPPTPVYSKVMDTAEPLVYGHTFEGLYLHALANRMTPAIKNELLSVGIDVSIPFLPTYPLRIWFAGVSISARMIFPDSPPSEAHHKLGLCFMDGYRSTLAGKVMLAVARILGPRKAIARASDSFRTATNYLETRISEVSDKCVDLWINEVGPYPEFLQGMIEATLSQCGANEIVAQPITFDGHSAIYRLCWK